MRTSHTLTRSSTKVQVDEALFRCVSYAERGYKAVKEQSLLHFFVSLRSLPTMRQREKKNGPRLLCTSKEQVCVLRRVALGICADERISLSLLIELFLYEIVSNVAE